MSGVVLDSYTDEAIAGATVTVQQAGSDEGLNATTDSDGSYQIAGVGEAFTVTVTAPDYASVTETVARTALLDVTLVPATIGGVVTDEQTGDPIADVTVAAGDVTATTNDDGVYELTDVPADVEELSFTSDDHAERTVAREQTTAVDVALRPDRVRTTLLNATTGDPVGFATLSALAEEDGVALTSARIDGSDDGVIELDGVPTDGYLRVLAPGYRAVTVPLEDGLAPAEIELEPFYARALYFKTQVAADEELMERWFDFVDETEINALVIDLKSDNLVDLGLIYYDSEAPLVAELGTSADLMDIEAILAEAKARDIYTIARVHVFSHDNLLAETRPEWAAQNARGCEPNETRKCNGDVFYADWDIAWLDPWNRNVWEYNIQLAEEAAQLGFDEVQFDYIRFPNDAADYEYMELSKPIDWQSDPQPMYENIAEFMRQAHGRINAAGAFFSVDIFGYAIYAPVAQIGQNAELMAEHADYIYPMIYPSHFAPNELGYDNVAEHPYEIIEHSLNRGYTLIGNQRAQMRPWLQDFTLIWVPAELRVTYGEEEVRAQIDAAEDSPWASGWALWDPDNRYTIEAIDPAPPEDTAPLASE